MSEKIGHLKLYFVAKIVYTCDRINENHLSVYTLKKIKIFQSIPLKSNEGKNQRYLPFQTLTMVKINL